MKRQIVVPLTADQFGPRQIWLPLVDVRVCRPGTQLGPQLRAIVDSGAAYTLAHRSLAGALGLNAADFAGEAPARLEGIGGARADAACAHLDLWIGPTRSEALHLPAARVFFTSLPLPTGYRLLLGQHDALELLTFVQLGHAAKRKFVLRFPD